MNKKIFIKNELKLIWFCIIIGAIAGIIFWLFLFLTNILTDLTWEGIPNQIGSVPYYPIIVCTLGGLVIGILRKLFGNYPQSMKEVVETVKKTGTYPYKKLFSIIILAMLPLVIGASVGPESGMVAIIVALCCWAGENLKFARNSTVNYSKVGIAVTLSILFHSPLFGIFHVEENEENDNNTEVLNTKSKFITYAIAVVSGITMYYLLSSLICEVSEGFPSFETALPTGIDYVVMIPYIIVGILFGIFFEKTEIIFKKLGNKLPSVFGELLAGIILGIIICLVPVIKFSGENQMKVLIEQYALYIPIAMIGLAFLKIIITNMCINFGLKGGHIFPLIFSSVCLAYGISLLIFPSSSTHAVFAAAIITAATMGVSLKKPIAVTMLLFLCFPIRMFFWIFLSATVSSYITNNKFLSIKE